MTSSSATVLTGPSRFSSASELSSIMRHSRKLSTCRIGVLHMYCRVVEVRNHRHTAQMGCGQEERDGPAISDREVCVESPWRRIAGQRGGAATVAFRHR